MEDLRTLFERPACYQHLARVPACVLVTIWARTLAVDHVRCVRRHQKSDSPLRIPERLPLQTLGEKDLAGRRGRHNLAAQLDPLNPHA
ncbi:MAG: hypothetical protein ACRDNK_16090 [Solirubrobacteraceae bacterium]